MVLGRYIYIYIVFISSKIELFTSNIELLLQLIDWFLIYVNIDLTEFWSEILIF